MVDKTLNLKEYVKTAKIFDYNKFQKSFDKIKNKEKQADKNNNINQKLETLKVYEQLFSVKNIILKIEDKMWYSPWIKVFVKQWLAERLDFSQEWVKKIKYILYFIIAQNFEEYKTLKKFFDETENIYQKENVWKKFVNTISILILFLVFYGILYFYVNAEIYKTVFFIFVFMSTAILWYFKKFGFDFKSIENKVKYPLFIWGAIVSFFTFMWTIWFFGFNIYAGLTLFLFLFFLYGFMSSIGWKCFNSWVYKISVFLFLVMLVIGFWQNNKNESIFIKGWKQVISTIFWQKIASSLFDVDKKKDFWKDNIVKVLVFGREWCKQKTPKIVKKKDFCDNHLQTDVLNEKP